MKWIQNYQLYLFDFDGLLVNTEHLHYQAYLDMCKGRGFNLDWSFPRYCLAAHREATALRDQIYAEIPKLKALEPSWDILYAEKKQAYIDLISQGNITLMPGAEKLLIALQQANIKRCVVTHSAKQLIDIIRSQHAILNTIPTWFTREDYSNPKPSPECYLKAINILAEPNDRIIGFEDSPRGLKALEGTRAQPVIICEPDIPGLKEIIGKNTIHFNSLVNLEVSSVLV
jgi:beta-phosphoglucomutase